MTYLDILQIQLRIDEAVKQFPYEDTTGHLTIGVGRNLTVVGLHPDEIALCLDNDIKAAVAVNRIILKDFESLNDARKAAICNMAFNLGERGMLEFTAMLKAIDEKRWADAARSMINSKWATQVKGRAVRLAQHMKEGV